MALNPMAWTAQAPGLAYTSRELSLVRKNLPGAKHPPDTYYFGQSVPNNPVAYSMHPGRIKFHSDVLEQFVGSL